MSELTITTRRDFLARGLGLIGVAAVLPNFLIRTALAAPPKGNNDERILVLLEMNGGHDGPSGLVPYGHEGYYRLRKATAIARTDVLTLNEEVGLHPNLKAFRDLLDQRAFAAVPGVGYPNPNYSHFEAMDIWHVADPRGRKAVFGSAGQRDRALGWIGRWCDLAYKGNLDPKLTLAVTWGVAPLALAGKEHPGLCFSNVEAFRYTGDRGGARRVALYRSLNRLDQTPCKDPAANLEYVTHTSIHANRSSEQIRQIALNYKTNVAYPTTSLANALRSVAGLIAGKLSTRVYFVRQGGYDTHSNQRPNHDRLMLELGNAVAAFQKDLAAQGNAARVLTMTYSEFGRRPEENASQGTDHGSAGPMFLFGPGVQPGVHGQHPSYEDFNPQKNFIHTTDFRNVYAAVLERWLGVPSTVILGPGFEPVDCIQA